MKSLITIIFIMLFIGCSKQDFKSGDCISSPDGFNWKINKIENNKYLAQKWQGNSWAEDINLDFGTVSLSNGYGIIACPKKD